MTEQEAHLNDWLTLIQGEYREMPGLRLTKCQVRKMWGLDSGICDSLLERLQTARFLRLTSDGCYVLNDRTARPRARAGGDG